MVGKELSKVKLDGATTHSCFILISAAKHQADYLFQLLYKGTGTTSYWALEDP